MIRILQVVNIMNRAGIENVLMNYYRNIDREKVQFDFLTHRPEKGAFDDEILALGGKIYRAPRLYPQNYLEYFKYMNQFFEEHSEYLVIHSHIDAMSFLPLLMAKRNKIPVRIAHSHNTNVDKDFKYILKQLFRAGINSVANVRYACSKEAGQYLFKKERFHVIPNALNTERFFFDSDVRLKKREELNLKDKFVIGHIGRFTAQKNHCFLINVFDKIAKENDNVVLLLVGDGELKEQITDEIKNRKLENQVIILDSRPDVNELYQAMDVFAFPSLYEGLGLVLVEAQVSGLLCLASDGVPEEAKISDKMEFLKLDENIWVKRIRKATKERNELRETVRTKRYDVREASVELIKSYTKLWNIAEEEHCK